MLRNLLLPLTLVGQAVLAADAPCKRVAEAAETGAAMYSPPISLKVTGSGRLYFYSAPDEACKTTKTFVIPGDTLIGYSELKGWTSVMYMTKSGDDVEGWVRSERLQTTGTLGPSRQ